MEQPTLQITRAPGSPRQSERFKNVRDVNGIKGVTVHPGRSDKARHLHTRLRLQLLLKKNLCEKWSGRAVGEVQGQPLPWELAFHFILHRVLLAAA